jgi:hypothetical protein
MSPADEMNRPLLAAGTPFADATRSVAAYGLGKTRSYQLEVSLTRKTGPTLLLGALSQPSVKRASVLAAHSPKFRRSWTRARRCSTSLEHSVPTCAGRLSWELR